MRLVLTKKCGLVDRLYFCRYFKKYPWCLGFKCPMILGSWSLWGFVQRSRRSRFWSSSEAALGQRGHCACKNPTVSEDWGNKSHLGPQLVGISPGVVWSWTEALHSSPCVERPWKVLLYSSLTFTLVMLVKSLSSEKGGSRVRRSTTQGRPLVSHDCSLGVQLLQSSSFKACLEPECFNLDEDS